MQLQLPTEITSKLGKGDDSKSKAIVNIYSLFMSQLHQSYSEIKQIPIPLAIQLIKKWEKEQKEIAKAQNGRRKH